MVGTLNQLSSLPAVTTRSLVPCRRAAVRVLRKHNGELDGEIDTLLNSLRPYTGIDRLHFSEIVKALFFATPLFHLDMENHGGFGEDEEILCDALNKIGPAASPAIPLLQSVASKTKNPAVKSAAENTISVLTDNKSANQQSVAPEPRAARFLKSTSFAAAR